jgi:hypothetical protein
MFLFINFFQTLVFGAYFLRWLAESKEHQDKVSVLKPILLESLVKNIISSKTKTPELILKVHFLDQACSYLNGYRDPMYTYLYFHILV